MSSYLARLLDETEQKSSWSARLYHIVLVSSAIAATALTALDTLPSQQASLHILLDRVEMVPFGVLCADFVLRVLNAVRNGDPGKGLGSYILSFMGLVDLVSAVPFLMSVSNLAAGDMKPLFGVVIFLKLARYSPALLILRDVLINERKPLLSSLYVMLLLTFSISTMMFFVERHDNPEGFSSIPQAMWWSVVTLATLGYGDVIPYTPLGKILGGIAAILGFGMFALPAGILANGFADEIRHIRRVTNWNLVAKVPLFANLEAGVISEISRMLQLRRFIRNETILKVGDRGESMYFIIEGEVEIIAGEHRAILTKGDFFGEIALLTGGRRTATAVARTRCRCLELMAYDFKQFIAKRPELLASINEVAARRYAADMESHSDEH